MSRLTSARNKIQKKVFDDLAGTATLQSITLVTDKWGDATETIASSTSIKIVPYNLFGFRKNYQPFGDLAEGESDAVIPYDTSFDINDKIILDGTTYLLTNSEEFVLQGGVLAFTIRISKQI